MAKRPLRVILPGCSAVMQTLLHSLAARPLLSRIKMLLTLFTRNIPLSFFRSSLDPFLGIVVTMAFFIKLGTFRDFLMLLNNFRREVFRFEPIWSF